MTVHADVIDLIEIVLDAQSFESWDELIDISGHSDAYREELERAAIRSGFDEAVLTGRGLVRGC